MGISLPILDLLGFDPQAQNGPDQLLALAAYFGLVPVLFYLGGILLVWRYPITRERQAELRRRLGRRQDAPSAAAASS